MSTQPTLVHIQLSFSLNGPCHFVIVSRLSLIPLRVNVLVLNAGIAFIAFINNRPLYHHTTRTPAVLYTAGHVPGSQ